MSNAKPINRSKTTEISDPRTYDVNNLIFDEPIKSEIPNSSLSFYRINLGTKNQDGKTEGELIFESDRCQTFGIKEALDLQTKALTGYSFGIMLYDKGAPTELQIALVETIQKIVEKCKDHLTDKVIAKKIKKANLERSDLKKMSPISFMKDKETEEEDKNAPVLNSKLLYKKPYTDKEGVEHQGKIITRFYAEDEVDENGEPLEIEPLDYINKRGICRAAIRLESIFVGKEIKLQAKIYESELKIEEKSGFRRLLRFGNMRSSTETIVNLNPAGQASAPPVEFEDEAPIVKTEEVQVEDEIDLTATKKKKAGTKKTI